MINIENHKLGETDETIQLATSEDNRIAAIALAHQADRSLRIFTRHLDSPIYNNKGFVDAVTQLAIRSPSSFIRVLVQDSTPAVKDGHRLVELGHRLSSIIKFRKPAEEYKDFNEAFLIADEVGLIHRKLADRFEGVANFKTPLEGRDLSKFFDEIWEKSAQDPELRRLDI